MKICSHDTLKNHATWNDNFADAFVHENVCGNDVKVFVSMEIKEAMHKTNNANK